MRKCIRCGTVMEEGFRIKAQIAGSGLDIVSGDLVFPKRIGTVKAAVCFSCGEVSLYIDLATEGKEGYAYVEKQKPAVVGSSFQTASYDPEGQ